MRMSLPRSVRLHRHTRDRHLSIGSVLRPDDLLRAEAGLGENGEVGG